MIRFIDEYRSIFSVEFICATLKNNRTGGFITSRGYRQSKARELSARRLRDAVQVERISAVHRDNYGVLGVRKSGMLSAVTELISVVNKLLG